MLLKTHFVLWNFWVLEIMYVWEIKGNTTAAHSEYFSYFSVEVGEKQNDSGWPEATFQFLIVNFPSVLMKGTQALIF